MATTQDIINAALQDIGVLADGETPSISASNIGLTAINNLVASWDLERLNIYSINNAAYSLTAAKQTYAIGPAAAPPDITAPRPISIRSASIIITNGSSKYVFPVELVPSERFSQELERSSKGDIPRILYNDNAYPAANLWLHPVPQLTGAQLELWTWDPLGSFATLAATFDLPPGYQRAIELNLAVELAPKFQRPVDQVLASIAAQAKDNIRGLNAPPYPGAGGEVQAQAAVQAAAQPPQPRQ